MGDIGFIFSKERGVYVERKYRHNGLFKMHYLDEPIESDYDDENEENLPPTPVNISAERIDALDQYDDEESFFVKRIRSNFIVNNVFLASVSLRQVKERGIFQNHVFVVKKLNYWH